MLSFGFKKCKMFIIGVNIQESGKIMHTPLHKEHNKRGIKTCPFDERSAKNLSLWGNVSHFFHTLASS